MMIHHHQGAIDMAQIELEEGHDPELRQMANEVVVAQQKEIEELKDWLERNGCANPSLR